MSFLRKAFVPIETRSQSREFALTEAKVCLQGREFHYLRTVSPNNNGSLDPGLHSNVLVAMDEKLWAPDSDIGIEGLESIVRFVLFVVHSAR